VEHRVLVEVQVHQEVLVRVEVQEHRVQVALQEVVVLQELLAQVDYQETTLLTQVDGVMRQVEGPLLPQGLVPIVQQFLQ